MVSNANSSEYDLIAYGVAQAISTPSRLPGRLSVARRQQILQQPNRALRWQRLR